jgi:hypothetical protein
MQREKMVVTEQHRDRFARTAELTLSRFSLSTPYFFTLVKNPDEFRFLIELTNDSPAIHFGGCVVRLFDAHKIIGDRVANLDQRTLDLSSSLIEGPFIRFRQDHPIIIDPASESTYYMSDLGKWTKDEQIHPKLRSLAEKLVKAKKRNISRKWRKGQNWTLWNYDVSRDPKLRHDLISSTFDLELHYGASVLLAPGPLIYDEVNLETAIEINELAVNDALDKDAEFANYLILSGDAILDKAVRKAIGDFLASTPIHLNVLKFKFLNLRNASIEYLRAYADFYRRLAEIREQRREKIFCALENDCQAFVSATVAFDLISTSMSGYDRYPRGRAKKAFGNIFISEELSHIKHETYTEAYVNNGERALCNHSPCQNVDPRTAPRSAWSAMTKKHYVLSLSELMAKISNYAIDHNIEQAAQDVINSYMSPLKKLIPTNWESPPALYSAPKP